MGGGLSKQAWMNWTYFLSLRVSSCKSKTGMVWWGTRWVSAAAVSAAGTVGGTVGLSREMCHKLALWRSPVSNRVLPCHRLNLSALNFFQFLIKISQLPELH